MSWIYWTIIAIAVLAVFFHLLRTRKERDALLQEKEVIYGGEKKLYAALVELIAAYKPKAAFVYATCIIGLIGDDLQAVCRKVEAEAGIPVIPVHSEGFRGTKRDGYKAAREGISIKNTSQFDDLVMLKHFGPNA